DEEGKQPNSLRGREFPGLQPFGWAAILQPSSRQSPCSARAPKVCFDLRVVRLKHPLSSRFTMSENPVREKPNPPGNNVRRVPVAGLRKGDRVVKGTFLVESANFKQTRNNKYFIQLLLRDRTGSIKAVRWEASQDLFNSFSSDDFLQINGRVEEFQQQLQI